MDKKVTLATQLCGTINLPADKSISHRAALFAALADGTSNISNYSTANDPQSTLSCLRKLGVSIQQTPLTFSSGFTEENDIPSRGDVTVVIKGVGRKGLQTPESNLDCGNSGTTMRLLSGIVGGAGIKSILTGDESLSARPMKRIIEPLREMDVEIIARKNDFAPLQIQRKAPIKSIHFELPIASAQLKSCVLLAGLFGDEETTVIETTPSRDHTERLLQLPVELAEGKRIISSNTSCKIPAQNYRVPGDFSAASYWLTAASVYFEATIHLPAVGMNPTRTGALDILQQMGAEITINNERTEGFEPVADIQAQSSNLEPVEVGPDLVPNCIDELPILMIAMLFADGTSTISGAGELRHKETDRLAAMAEVLRTAGASFKEEKDGMVIHGNPNFIPKAGTFNSYGDHRIAMSAAILSLLAKEPSQITKADCTAISYPGFWTDLKRLKAKN